MRPIVAISALFTSVMLLAGTAAADGKDKPAETGAGQDAKARSVSLSEFVERATKRMKMADKNKDGVLTKEELAARRPKKDAADGKDESGKKEGKRGPKDGEHAKDGGKDKGKDGKKDHAGRVKRPSFEELDANKDGQVTVAEVEASARQRFATLDKDKDGQLTAAELPRLGKHGRKQRGEAAPSGRKGRAPSPTTDA